MHQFLILVFFIALSAFNQSGEPLFAVSSRTTSFIAVFGFVILALTAVVLSLAARWHIKKASRTSLPRWYSKFHSVFPLLVLAAFLASLSVGWLFVLRNQFPGSWFLPEYATVTQPIALLVLAHGLFIWVKQRAKANKLAQSEGSLQRIEPGESTGITQPTLAGQDPDRPGLHGIADALINYLRHHVAFIAVPLLIIVAWHRMVDIYLAEPSLAAYKPYEPLFYFSGTISVFILAPVIITRIWHTHAMPQGPLNESLLAMCRRYGVGVNRILVWHTKGTLINAAVMGVTGRFRFILLTDGLLDKVHPVLIQAVMAHEIAHIRLRHIPWLLASAFAMLAIFLTGSEFIVLHALPGAHTALSFWPNLPDDAGNFLDSEAFKTVAVSALGILFWVPAFGWVSRRFERQADTFAVEHFASDRPQIEQPTIIKPDDAQAMVGALDAVASLNAIPVTQKSWRHGAIRWRQDYLLTLVGKPVGSPGVHRSIACIKMATVVVIVALIAIVLYTGQLAAFEKPVSSSATAQALADPPSAFEPVK